MTFTINEEEEVGLSYTLIYWEDRDGYPARCRYFNGSPLARVILWHDWDASM
jgi:hypothetical protein